jgi:hypothetical protein
VLRCLLAWLSLACHFATKKSGIDLLRPAGLLAGGESGPALNSVKLEESLLWERTLSKN